MIEKSEELRRRAESVLNALSATKRDGPFFVEFSGSPKSGKSSCIDIVGHFFRRLGYRVLAPTEGASKRTPYYLKDDFVAFNAWSACYALSHVLEGLYHSDKSHIAILDRGLFDALVWFEFLAAKGDISEKERDHVHNFLLIDKWRSVIDVVFLFKSDPDTSLDRENRDKLIREPGRAMNPDFLRDLNEAYDQARDKYAGQFSAFEVVDTSKSRATTPQSTASYVVELILGQLEGAQQ